MVSDKEIEAAIKAIEAVPIMDDTYSLSGEDAKAAARAALSAAARVRAEANAGVPVAWGEDIDGKIVSVRLDKNRHCTVPLYPAPQPSGPVDVTDDMANAALKRSMDKHLSLLTNTEAMREIIKAALSALTASKPEQAVSSGWQPIETAPADGRVILVYEARSAYPIHLRSADGDWWRKQGVGPSHWMPLPAAPTAGGGDA